MKTRLFSLAAIAVLLLNVAGLSAGDTRSAKNAQTTRLVALLPASDGVFVFDSKRFLTDALPKVLSANQPLLAQIIGKLDAMQARTGIDPRKFDQVAVGVNFKQVSATEMDYDTVALLSGDINFGVLIAAAKLASKGAYRSEMVGDRPVLIFTVADAMKQHSAKIPNSKLGKVADRVFRSFSKEIAVATIDRNTLAVGSLPRVRETLDAASHVGADISSLLSTKETAVMSFAVKTTGGLSRLLPLDNDEIKKNVDSIQYLSGSLDVAIVGTSLQMMARTTKPEQALVLKDTLDVLQIFGGGFLGSSKRADQQVYGRMIKSAKFETRGLDVTLDLLVPQSDIDSLIAGIK